MYSLIAGWNLAKTAQVFCHMQQDLTKFIN